MSRPTRTKHLFAVILACLLDGFLLGEVMAENGDEIQIRADYMKFDLETGSGIYEGNVSIIQGSIQLSGDKVVISRDPNNINEISDIEITGNPARYQQDGNTANKVNAASQHMKYSTRESRLVMTDNARLEQSDHVVESQLIVYDTAKKVMIAGKEGLERVPGERVNITLTPKKTSSNNNH